MSAIRLRRDSIPDQIFHDLKNRIITSEWAPGTKIPSETEIGEMYGASRLSARTAIQRLAAFGLVDVRVGDGTYVKDNPLKDYLNNGAVLLLTIRDLDDFADFRNAFDNSYMAIACEKRTDEDIVYVKSVYDQMMDDAIRGDLESFHYHDFRFHGALCRCTHNEYFVMIYRLIGKLYNEHLMSSTESFSTLPGMSMDVEADDYYLKQLVKFHYIYITALEKRDFNIATGDMEGYQQIYRDQRHVLSED